MAFSVVPPGLEAFSAANAAAAQAVAAAGSADQAANVASATAALGPIGAEYLAAYGPAQANNFASTQAVAGLHAAIAAATEAAKASFIATDNG
ncbi:hypothetical protein M1247_26405 [Mycobacterium sp. 21AC1]|uniref:hypothetical protein n=1 Tax=[Mycobacterium] appelbergii TaxID=2939269 RepID=UPI0029393B84|nr:hypothetical protein [Mycobacterium sp. 21AC1]MDV3128468.1 hypothetical protein [Mycobacterium sp. 21AC1]